MQEQPRIVTSLGYAELDRVLVRGHDLTEELVGNITFSQMACLELTGRLPTPDETRMFDALLVILVEHGMVSNVVSARITYHSAPEAIQGAVAASLLAAGSVHLGSSEWCAKMLVDALAGTRPDEDLAGIAQTVVDDYADRKQRVPGLGHRTHNQGDPRANRLLLIARETGTYGRHCQLLELISKAAEQKAGRRLPVNVTGAIGAIALDLGLPWQMTKAFALIGRTLGAIAHIGEEIRNPTVTTVDSLVKSVLVYDAPVPEKPKPAE